ncbi:MAG: type I restriction enzyme HsdR N-terminal domain-containing protein [Thermoanaerobaculia bacterium]
MEFLLEVKAIGLDLKDSHIKQVVDYAANEGVEWVAVTNGQLWRVFRVTFGKPIDNELVLDIDLLNLKPRDPEALEALFLLTRESILKSALRGFHDQLQATNRYALAAILEGDAVLSMVRRELRRVSPDVKIDLEDLREKMKAEVLKRDVIEGADADAARKKVSRAAAKMLRIKKSEDDEEAERAPVGGSPAKAASAPPKVVTIPKPGEA